MTAAVLPLGKTGDQLLSLMEDIALGRGGHVDWSAIRALAWCGHTPESLTAAWDDFRQTVRAREALATGTRTWTEFYEPDDCGGHDHAIDLKTSELDDTYRTLIHGPRGGAR